ncbi:hypothetical protein GCM10009821_06950 [Aeromicrobium halocynthiae]|uniref:TIGR03089 family protein n=1 Tax=Aeromicrobium halocynthiae TaxID=560557 RepID=A0ABP5HCD3_9ACTN
MSTLADLLSRMDDPSRPLLTFDDRRTGERVELSGTTTANWVAKTANFLTDDLDAGPGTRVRIGLPPHWLRYVWLLSCWTVGATVATDSADIGLSGPDLRADEPERVAASLRPLGARFAEPPEGFVDVGAEVPGHGDVFVPLDPPQDSTAAVDLPGLTATHAELLTSAVPCSNRVLTPPLTIVDDVRLLVDVLVGGGSIVLATGADDATMTTIAVQERAVRR